MWLGSSLEIILATQRTTFLKAITYLKVLSYFVEGDVDGERGGVMVRSERPLSVRAVFHNKVQESIALQQNIHSDFRLGTAKPHTGFLGFCLKFS